MIKKAINLLKQPYPIGINIPKKIYTIFGFGLFVVIFIKVFGLADKEGIDDLCIIFGFGLITVFVMINNWIFLPLVFPVFFKENNWIVIKEILFHIWNIFLIGTANLVYAYIGGYYEINIFTFIHAQLTTFGVAIFPVTFLILLNYNRLLKKYVKSAKELNKKIQSKIDLKKAKNKIDQQIYLYSENGNESIQIHLHNLLLIKSVENYIEIHLQEKGNCKRFYLRNSLKKIEEEFTEYSFIFRCHRSYIINMNKIKKVFGNSQGYKLLMDEYEIEIPVARSCSKKFKNKITSPCFSNLEK
jgi:hypothetical protein